jgi:prepilin-type processing-associated H-X9-DG protein
LVTNDPPVGNETIAMPFGRPDPNNPYGPPVERAKKVSMIKKPSDTWAMLDCDKQLLKKLGYTGSTYYEYVALEPVHGSKEPALRNYLYFDFHVSRNKTPW